MLQLYQLTLQRITYWTHVNTGKHNKNTTEMQTVVFKCYQPLNYNCCQNETVLKKKNNYPLETALVLKGH